MKKRPAAFIDRDGTLIEEVNFLSRIEDLRLFPFTNRAIYDLKRQGFLVIVVTNQSGIGRGLYTAEDMGAIHGSIQDQLGGAIDAFYHCPHRPDERCSCRKPGLGMLDLAMEDFEIDLANSWMIGDKVIDVETGFNAKIRTAMVLTGYGQEHHTLLEREPDVLAEDLGAAVSTILKSGTAEIVI